MNKYILVILILVALLFGYLVFGTYTKTDNQGAPLMSEETVITGTVTVVDRSQRVLDGPTLISIVTSEGVEKTIAVPSMGINLCRAALQIADVEQLAVGDTVIVRGEEDESSAIVPCEGEGDKLIVVGKMLDATFGYEFEYRKGPDGYITLEDTTSEHKDYVTGMVIYDAQEYEFLRENEDVREGPPAIRMRVYQNPDKLSSSVWAIRNGQEVNRQLMIGEESEAVVGGANAAHFLTDGLYTTEVYVVAHSAHIYVLSGDYSDTESMIRRDYNDFVTSFSFIPTPNQLGTGAKINPRVACESALAFMTFSSSEDADAFVTACVNGEHPEVIERYIRDSGFDGAAI